MINGYQRYEFGASSPPDRSGHCCARPNETRSPARGTFLTSGRGGCSRRF